MSRIKRYASHYVWCGEVCRLHYVELTDTNQWIGCFPLTHELASTTFLDGVLVPLPEAIEPQSVAHLCQYWWDWTSQLLPGDPVRLYLLQGLSPSSAKLGTDDGGGDGHIQRL